MPDSDSVYRLLQAVIPTSHTASDESFIRDVQNLIALKDTRGAHAHADAARLFIRHILENKKGKGTVPHWEHSLAGICTIIQSLSTDGYMRNRKEAAIIKRQIYAAAPEILEVIWRDRQLLNSGTPHKDALSFLAEKRMSHVARFIVFSGTDPSIFRSFFCDNKVLKLSFQCWLNTSPHYPELHGQGTSAILAILRDRSVWDGMATRNRHELFHGVVQIEHLTSKLNFLLKHKGLLGEELRQDLHVLFLLSVSDNGIPLIHNLLSDGVLRQLLIAVRRQIRDIDQPELATDYIFKLTEGILDAVLLSNDEGAVPILTELAEKACMIEVSVAGLKYASRYSHAIHWDATQRHGTFHTFFTKMQHCFLCEDRTTCGFHFHAPKNFLDVLRPTLERTAIGTLVFLIEELPMGGKTIYIELWMKLLRAIGISEPGIRDRYRLDRKCCNVLCPTRPEEGLKFGKQLARKRMCVRCQGVYYCNRDCQKSDWSTHKSECPILASRGSVVDSVDLPILRAIAGGSAERDV